MQAVLPHNDPSDGWFARLDLCFGRRAHATVPHRNRHVGPLRLQRPLYPEDASVCHACILHPPGGVVGGDRLELHAEVESDAAALITTPGAAKFYRSNGATASQQVVLEVRANGTLEWLPQETIVFPGACADLATRVHLAADAGFIGWEILCIGLPACGHPFREGLLRTTLEIRRQDRPIFMDRLRIAGDEDLNRPTGMRGCSVTGTFVAVGCRPDMAAPLRRILEGRPETLAGLTVMDDVLVARCLGNASAAAKSLFEGLWTWLRPHLSGRPACAPRIWAT